MCKFKKKKKIERNLTDTSIDPVCGNVVVQHRSFPSSRRQEDVEDTLIPNLFADRMLVEFLQRKGCRYLEAAGCRASEIFNVNLKTESKELYRIDKK